MKKLSLILLFLFSFACTFGQAIVNRSNASITVSDARHQAQYNQFIPRYSDTTTANISKGIDSCGAIIFTYTGNTLWVRGCSPKRWLTAGSGAGGISSFNFNSDSTVIICYSNGVCDTISMTNSVFATTNYVDSSISIVNTGTCYGALPNGNVVTWSGSGLKFYVTGGDFFIGCRRYTGLPDSITLSAADPTNPRFDVIYRDTLGTIGVVEGTPAGSPSIPQVNPSYQLALTAILVLAGDTIPANVYDCHNVYDENLQVAGGEWNSLATSSSVDPDQTPVASHLTHSTYFNNVDALGVAYSVSTDVPTPADAVIRFKILFTTFGKQIGNSVPIIPLGVVKDNSSFPYNPLLYSTYIQHGQNGFDSTNKTTWQPIAVPISQFKFNGFGSSPDSIGLISISAIADTAGGNPGATWYIDEVKIQCGLNQGGVPTGNFLTDVFSTPGAVTDTLWKVRGADTSLVVVTDRNCGVFSPGIVTWDSLLVFSVSPSVYRLCCDGVRRTSDQTQLTLSAADATFGRFDLIALDSNGVVVVEGDPSASPALPQPTDCQLVLTYIYIPAGATEPGDGDNGCGLPASETIYDQNTGAPEWTPTASIVTVDFSNTANPYHFTIAADVGSFSTFGSAVTFTRSSTIDLSQYSAIKFFIRLKSSFGGNTYIGARFLNSSTNLGTTTAFIQNGQFNFSRTTTGSYQEITIPVSVFLAGASTITVDRLSFFLYGSNSQGFYIDYIQLQSGICQPPGTITLPTFSAGDLSPLFTTTETNNTTTYGLNFNAISQSQYVVYGRGSGSGVPSFNALDTNYISGFSTYVRPLLSAGTGISYDNTTGVITSTVTGTVTSVGLTMPSAFSVANSPVTTSGTLAVTGAGTTAEYIRGDGSLATFPSISTPTLQQVFDTEVGGSVLTKIDTILGGAFGLKLTGTSATVSSLNIENNSIGAGSIVNISSTSTAAASNLQKGINVAMSGANATSTQTTYGVYSSNTHSGTTNVNYAVYGTVSNGVSSSVGVYGVAAAGETGVGGLSNSGAGVTGNSTSGQGGGFISTSGIGVSGTSSSTYGLQAQSTSAEAANLIINPASTNTIEAGMRLTRSTQGTAANGIGVQFNFHPRTSTTLSNPSAGIASTWTDVTNATRTGDLQFWTTGNATPTKRLVLDGFGSITLTPITATAASAITPAEGMIVFTSDTDATFTSVGFWGYQGGAWVKM